MGVSLRALIGRLNDTTRGVVEASAGLALSRTHYDVEVEHFLLKLLDVSDCDAAFLFRHLGVDKARVSTELMRSLDKLKSGNARTPALSPSLVKMLTEGWLAGSVDFGAEQIRTGHCVLALVTNTELSRLLREVSPELAKMEAEALRKDFEAVLVHSAEQSQISRAASTEAGGATPAGSGKTPNLDQFTVNMTDLAKKGKIDPVVARDFEIRQVVDILTRRRQNNPILVGEAGVGKTAIVEGFALRVANGDVPPSLQKVSVRSLDLALLQAGAGIKGEFENRLKGLINEVKSSPTPIILFIDEAHTMIGAGGQAGQNDAANLLKPALARGELRTIAATTWSEYMKYFEKDPALTRRFQVVKVDEPGEVQCAQMIRSVVPALELHHSVRILDEGIAAAVRLSHRFLPDRQLPDKAVSVLDTACARLALGQNATPPQIENAQRSLEDLAVRRRILEREIATGADHSERIAAIAADEVEEKLRLEALGSRWEKERDLVTRIREARTQLEETLHQPVNAGSTGSAQGTAAASTGVATQTATDPEAIRAGLATLNQELEALQGEAPLMRVCVDAQVISEVVSAWTGIPAGKMLKDEISAVLSLESVLGNRVIGQTHALEAISERIRTSKAAMEDPVKPVGTFLLVGPSGVGKTETALSLADLFYGGERNLITINMSEFQEAHTVSTLKGSPPGYVGYGEGGVLTEAVRRRPYSVVLLDEVEKAHPDVLELFFQVFDKGRMEDGEGREIDFRNTIILLTSNAGTDTLMKLCSDPETMPSPEGLVKALKPELNKIFKPAFLGRLVIIPYMPIRDEALRRIILLKLGKVERRLQETHKVSLSYDEELVSEIARRCTEVESGARNVDNILTNTVLPQISRQILTKIAQREELQPIRISVGENGAFVYE